ncbi:uncharacterized protein LOC18094106 isoform X2 [Populus trichocarpa]|uniref:uncharacterized protein LOC18094106 isoform X2 n=1 Tax=Populus trichocarpa TaxID=3694 RepID=UPI000CCD0329|nr:uncharacterized protein LOC18094106 isoform X2 [Populus trichocarpa]|eukprot:XP_006368337.2 uncharacterized protein LOC18094106 [Populus trichocarpa]
MIFEKEEVLEDGSGRVIEVVYALLHLSHAPGQKGINQENTMVLVKAMLKYLVLFLVLFTSSVSVHSVAGEAVGKNNVAKSYRSWRRINHGSARGPRKHLVNPTVEHPFEVPELPV